MEEGKRPTLVVLTGPTGVGKSSLSVELALHYNTDIISSDSRQIFKEMTIGTAVPTKSELEMVKHHFIQSHTIDDNYNASRFESEVLSLLEDLFKTRDVVFMTGGSMMYIDAVCKGIDIMPDIDSSLRERLQERYAVEGIENIKLELKELDPIYYEQVDLNNHKRVIHALEICITTGERYSDIRTGVDKPRSFNIVKICIDRDRAELYSRIDRRVIDMVDQGLVDEARALMDKRDLPALNTVGYKEMFNYFDGEWTLDFAIERLQANTRKYARKQLTWFRRDGNYKWFHPEDGELLVEYLDTQLL